jgi:hypothetical protein
MVLVAQSGRDCFEAFRVARHDHQVVAATCEFAREGVADAGCGTVDQGASTHGDQGTV